MQTFTRNGPGDYIAAPPTGHAADPTTPEPDSRTSLQPLGEASVLVCFEAYGRDVEITGAVIDGMVVDSFLFAANVVGRWQEAIQDELRQQFEADAEAALQDRAECEQ